MKEITWLISGKGIYSFTGIIIPSERTQKLMCVILENPMAEWGVPQVFNRKTS